jgi:nucleoside-diphosphate-sugar epimerase
MAAYLVTGAAGFIASRVTELLLAAGHQVVGIDNLNDAYDLRLKRWRLDRLLGGPNFHFRQLDISDRSQVNGLASEGAEFAAVVNLAARAGVRQSTEDPWVYIDTNITGTLNLLEFCRAHRIPKFVLASTSSLYGGQNTLPYREDADTSRPLSPYAASKKGAEALCHTFHHLYGIDVTVFRYFTAGCGLR